MGVGRAAMSLRASSLSPMGSDEPVIAEQITMAEGHVKRCNDLYGAAIADYQIGLADIRKEKEGLVRDLGAKDDELAAALKEKEAGEGGAELSPDKVLHDSQGDNIRRRTAGRGAKDKKLREAETLKKSFIAYGLNSSVPPKDWNPEEMIKFESVKGATTWDKFRLAVTQERKKNESLDTDLRKAKTRENALQKKWKSEKSTSKNSNKLIDNLRERNEKMRLLLTEEAMGQAVMADEAETEAYKQIVEREACCIQTARESREKMQEIQELLENQKREHEAEMDKIQQQLDELLQPPDDADAGSTTDSTNVEATKWRKKHETQSLVQGALVKKLAVIKVEDEKKMDQVRHTVDVAMGKLQEKEDELQVQVAKHEAEYKGFRARDTENRATRLVNRKLNGFRATKLALLQDDVEGYKHELEHLKQQLIEFKEAEEAEDLRQNALIEEYQQEKEYDKQTIEDMEARLARVQERLNLATEKNERMEEEQRNAVAELSRTGSNLAELDDARKESEILAAQIDSLIADKKELKDEKDRFEDLSNEQATEIEALKLQIKNLTEELALLTGRQDDLKKQNDEINTQLAQMELLAQQVHAFEDRVDTLHNENEGLAEKVRNNESDLLEKAHAGILANDQYEASLAELRLQLHDTQTELQDTKHKLSRQKDHVRRLKQNVSWFNGDPAGEKPEDTQCLLDEVKNQVTELQDLVREKDIELHKADAKVRKWKLKVSWFQGVPVSSPKSSPNKSGLDSDLDFLHQCRQQNAALEDQLQAANTELGKSHDVIRNLKQDVSWFKSTKCPVCERKTGQTEGDEANKQELVAELKVWKLQSEGLEDLVRAKNLEILQVEDELRIFKKDSRKWFDGRPTATGKDPASELKAKITLLEQNLETEKSERERERNDHRFEKDQLEREIHQKDDELGRIRTDITSQVSELEIHNQEERDKNKDDADKYRKKAAVAEEQVELLLAQKNDLQTIMYGRVNELDSASTEWESKYNALKDIVQLKDQVIVQLKETLARKEDELTEQSELCEWMAVQCQELEQKLKKLQASSDAQQLAIHEREGSSRSNSRERLDKQILSVRVPNLDVGKCRPEHGHDQFYPEQTGDQVYSHNHRHDQTSSIVAYNAEPMATPRDGWGANEDRGYGIVTLSVPFFAKRFTYDFPQLSNLTAQEVVIMSFGSMRSGGGVWYRMSVVRTRDGQVVEWPYGWWSDEFSQAGREAHYARMNPSKEPPTMNTPASAYGGRPASAYTPAMRVYGKYS